MNYKAGKGRDPFAFSLGGMATIASVVAPPIVADNRFNEDRDASAEQSRTSGADLPSYSQGQLAPCGA